MSVDNCMRLASLLATARVRRYAVSCGRAPQETEDGTNKRVERATAELRAALEELACPASSNGPSTNSPS